MLAVVAEKYHNQPLTPLFECDIDPNDDSTFLPLMNFMINALSNSAALFELFNYGCSTITLHANTTKDGASTLASYRATVYEPFPTAYAQERWASDKSLVGRIEVMFQYGFHLYGQDIPTHHFTHPADHFHTEKSAYTHPAFHCYRHPTNQKVGELHLQESLQARWDADDYVDEGTNTEQYLNTVFNAVAAVLGVTRRKSTMPVYEEFLEKAYPPMTQEEVQDTLKRETGLNLIAQAIAQQK